MTIIYIFMENYFSIVYLCTIPPHKNKKKLVEVSQRVSFSQNSDLSSILADLRRMIVTAALESLCTLTLYCST